MGCDIHAYCEFYLNAAEGWEISDSIFKDWLGAITANPCTVRDYELFHILGRTDRNQMFPVGFGNNDGEDCFPEDSCFEITRDYESWGSDKHSANYATLRELLAYNWDYKQEMRGLVDAKGFNKILLGDIPDTYYEVKPKAVTCKIVSNERMRQLISRSTMEPVAEVLTWAGWNISPRTQCAHFVAMLEELTRYCKKNKINHNECRLVFWFDT
jgi:hypothetical protein